MRHRDEAEPRAGGGEDVPVQPAADEPVAAGTPAPVPAVGGEPA